MRLLVLVALAACGGHAAPREVLVPSSARLPAPAPVDPGARGADYLTQVAAELQPRWADFLEDCRLRLPRAHPLNHPALAATFELAIGRAGELVWHAPVSPSGNGDFDTAIADVLADASPLPAPPSELASDDELVHLRWQFARDRRQAGPRGARVVTVELPLRGVVERLIAHGELARAARRILAAPVTDPARSEATERVMIAALREALGSPDGAARRAAVEASGRARVHELAEPVRRLGAAVADPELGLAAIRATGAIGDRAAAPALLVPLRGELLQHAPLALARVAALVALGATDQTAGVVRAVLEAGPNPTALAALALLPSPDLAPRLTAWAASPEAATRGAVCAALPGAAPANAARLILRGLRDPDARVRAACADAAARGVQGEPDPALLRRLHALARDRDRSVRAAAVAAIGLLDPAHPVRAADDPAPEVRAAFAATAPGVELRALAEDRDPEVRAAALTALGDRAGELAEHASRDPSAVVRRAAIPLLGDPALLAGLLRDDSPDVATAALVRQTSLRGRAAETAPLLERLAAAPVASIERVRIALAWLLAS